MRNALARVGTDRVPFDTPRFARTPGQKLETLVKGLREEFGGSVEATRVGCASLCA